MYSTRAIPQTIAELTELAQRLIDEIKEKDAIIAQQQAELTSAYCEIADLQRKYDGARFTVMQRAQEYERLERRYHEMRMAQP